MSWLVHLRQFWSSHLTLVCTACDVHPLQAAVGGRMRLFISGGAPLPPYAGAFIATAMNVPVLQVSSRCYGQCCCLQWPTPWCCWVDRLQSCLSRRHAASQVCPRVHPQLKSHQNHMQQGHLYRYNMLCNLPNLVPTHLRLPLYCLIIPCNGVCCCVLM